MMSSSVQSAEAVAVTVRSPILLRLIPAAVVMKLGPSTTTPSQCDSESESEVPHRPGYDGQDGARPRPGWPHRSIIVKWCFHHGGAICEMLMLILTV
jgi:hypothetical protein